MRLNSGQVIGAVVSAAFIFQLASARQAETRAPPIAAGETIEANGANSPLIITRMPRPKYPREAKGVSGWVRVECVVSPQGRIQSVRVVESQPAGLFDRAAIDAMKAARFNRTKSPEPRLMVQRLIFSPN
jgi:periplasmic protein TonB